MADKKKALHEEVKERTVSYVVAALGLVAGLAWNEAVKAAIEEFFPLKANTVFAKFVYAAIITLIIVVITVNLLRFIRKEEQNNSK